MWWSEASSRRRLVAAGLPVILALVAGCNLRPLHARHDGPNVTRELAAVDVQAPRSRLGQIVENELMDELQAAGQAAPPRYVLDIVLERATNALAIQLDDTVTRYDLTLFARFELRRKADNALLFVSAARRVASYNVVRAPYATLAAEQDAERRAAVELAHEIRSRLALHFADRGEGSGGEGTGPGEGSGPAPGMRSGPAAGSRS